MWEKTRQIFEDSIERTLGAIAAFLPVLLAMLVLLGLSMLAAIAVRSLAHRLFARAQLDQRLRSWGVAHPASVGRTDPSVVIARVIFWMVLLLGFLGGLSGFDATTTLAKQLLGYLPHVVVGLVVFVAGLAGSRIIERSVLIEAVNAGLHSARLLGLGARWLVVVLAAAMALEQLGVGGTILVVSFSILFGGIVLALSLAVGLGARATVARSLEKVFSATEERSTTPAPAAPVATSEVDKPPAEYHHM